MKRLDQLTFTRFLALLLVIFYHGGGGVYINWMGSFIHSVLVHSAPTAVSYLYVLSGFVMSLVYFRPGEKFAIFDYWKTRFIRIYPLYILSFILVCYYYLDYIARIKPIKILVNIFVLQAWWPPYAQSFNYASWSMTVEFFFYALFPFFTIWAYRQTMKKLFWVSISLWIVTQLVHYTLWIGYFPEWELFIVFNPIFHLNSFILGVVGGIWFLREGQDNRSKPGTILTILLTCVVLISGYAILSNRFPQLPNNLQPMAGLLSPLFTLFITVLAMDRTRLSTVLSHRWFVTLGETAYALYILHVPVIWIYERAIISSNLNDPQKILDITYLPLMISVGLVAYLYIDPPLRRWLKSILGRVSLPLLVLDLVIIAVSIYLSFRLRFGAGREFNSYRTTALLMFWSAFLMRTIISVASNSLNPSNFHLPMAHMLRPVVIAVPAGSILVALMLYAGYSAGWVENFPRSVILIDLAILSGFSVLLRLIFRGLDLYPPKNAQV